MEIHNDVIIRWHFLTLKAYLVLGLSPPTVVLVSFPGKDFDTKTGPPTISYDISKRITGPRRSVIDGNVQDSRAVA